MPCYHPLQAYRSRQVGEPLRFSRRDGYEDRPVSVPCGRCVGCRLERSRQWAVRCMHEAQLYDDNCFLTLTYDEANLPSSQSVEIRDFQLFMKKLRRHFEPRRIRFLHCGEYGDENLRPHYHAIVFNLDFDDKTLFFVNNGKRIYVSETLTKIWSNGHASIGDVTFESAAYVARYCMKKLTGDVAAEHYRLSEPVILEDVCWFARAPEYATMSQSVGRDWFLKFGADVYPKGFVTLRGRKMAPPKAYRRFLEEAALPSEVSPFNEPSLAAHMKARSMEYGRANAAEETPERRRVREAVKLSQISRLKRSLE